MVAPATVPRKSQPLRRWAAAAATATAALWASSSLVSRPADLLTTSFVSGNVAGNSGLLAPLRHNEELCSRVAMAATGPTLEKEQHRQTPNGWKRRMMKRMPSSNYDTETIMRRVVTVLVKNIDEKWRDAPMRTRDIMKEVGLRGKQIRYKSDINKALYLLLQQKVVSKYKQNPIRWEIHEDYREHGVPRISWNENDPWRYCHEIEFSGRTTIPKHGPTHGQYRPIKEIIINPVDNKAEFKHSPDKMPEYMPLWEPPVEEEEQPDAEAASSD